MLRALTDPIRVAYDAVVQSYRLHMTIDRVSGQDSNWVTTNRPFLERLRKYLMQWRSMSPEQHLVYVAQADALFAAAGPGPAEGAPHVQP